MRAGEGRIAGLDVLRGFAASAVMLHHHAQYYDVLYPGRIPLSIDLGPGHFGVELFFIISGFVILMTIERKKMVREFAISRTARLMPAFLAALLIATTIRTLWVLGYAIIRWGIAQGWSTLQGVIAAGLASLMVATLLHYVVERPGGRWMRTVLSRWQPPAVAA